ncbi:hypothetical protein QE152_g7464 [Popillia japonica]|uniref:Uncharacterized protein n=1 Tax=Popillia japonica TaxID=7064 RepID=A0AAW1MEU7_POPJA
MISHDLGSGVPENEERIHFDSMVFTQNSTDLENVQNNFDQHHIDYFPNSDRTLLNTQEYQDGARSNITWKSLNESVQNKDVKISDTIEALTECSTYFTQEWDEVVDMAKNSGVDEVKKMNPKVIIQIVHVINKEGKITAVQKFDPDQGQYREGIFFNLILLI